MVALYEEKRAPPEFLFDNAPNFSGGRQRLAQVDRNSPVFTEIARLFSQNWTRSEKYKPQIQFIFKVLWPERSLQPYYAYRDQIQSSMQAADGRGNEKLLFHGTNRACLLGESPSSVLLCCHKKCSLCSILRDSFAVDKCGTKNAFKRYGDGIYLTSCSSKADGYACNLSASASLRVMLVNRVVVGNSFKTQRNAPKIVPLSPKYNSVEAEPGPESDLIDPETAIYDNAAARPAYVVVYGKRAEAVPHWKVLMKRMF